MNAGQIKKLALLVLLVIAASASAQDIYKWKDDKGQWHFSQTPPANRAPDDGILKDTSLPEQMKTDEPCTPFKVGEARSAKAYRPSPELPHLELKDTQVILIESTSARATFSWKAVVANHSTSREVIIASMTFSNCNGFPLSEKRIDPEVVLPGQQTTISGRQDIFGASTSAARRFNLGVTRLPQTERSAAPPVVLEKEARLSILWSRLQEVESQVILYGEVYNAGAATARDVRVSYIVKTKEGVTLTSGQTPTIPADMRPGQTCSFKIRIAALSSLTNQTAFLDVAYSK